MHVAGDGHFHLEPQSHVTPKAAPMLEGKVLLGLAVPPPPPPPRSCQHLGQGGGGSGGRGFWERRRP